MFHDKQVKCGDQNNPDLYKKPMIGKALCLPETIGSTTGGMVLYTACASGQQPACMLFSKHIDSLAASGAILASVWTDADMPVIDAWATSFRRRADGPDRARARRRCRRGRLTFAATKRG
ncbi:MAG: aconitase X swivel domain-containing protein [Oscillospiraceae bacterium]